MSNYNTRHVTDVGCNELGKNQYIKNESINMIKPFLLQNSFNSLIAECPKFEGHSAYSRTNWDHNNAFPEVFEGL